ncbi:hypothetical protein ARALYDRAFT_359413 [Arabidopsis lyrata subsp. lyrata]|uniref:E1 ubiquitin-activating enzyme n=1 Tax=Arabidopsis lyrata subsp. lyrata TaxID=81972 RepID=D7MWT8_ARALL|nr:hypothetical protein ARALYDRAFT_359413 [Arabidopsis lyrata subsp. lyrata]
MGISHVLSRFFHHFMLHKRASEANDKNDNSIIGSDLASSKKRRIDITDSSSSDNKSSIVASGSSSSSSGFHGDSVAHQIDMAFGNSNRQEIDEDLHSRQLAVYGRETMRRLFASNVLISGMHGLGAEIEEDAQKLISIATAINTGQGDLKVENVDQKLLRHFSFGAKAVLNPMAAMFGGIVGQEVVKACSGKFHPLFQFFYFDSVESLPTEPLDSSDFAPRNSRYDAQISVFGAKFQKKLEDAKVFTVGSGALGCEFLKNMALMGVSCGSQGKLTVTDDDIIEKSNLSRQFLFRDWNIGQAKSTVAASAAAAINPRFNIEALQNRVGAETENVFDDAFWENLTVVVNALDNVNARLYVDSRCLYFQKPLLESGTLGAKCNTQMVIPHLTENYGASRDPPEKQAPMCTVHSFPHNIDHCLTWARSEFEGLLEKTPAEVNAYLSSPVEYTNSMMSAGDAQARDTLERILECLDKEKCETFQDCLTWARLRYYHSLNSYV